MDQDQTAQPVHVLIGIITATVATFLSILCIASGIIILKVAEHRRKVKNRYVCMYIINQAHQFSVVNDIITEHELWSPISMLQTPSKWILILSFTVMFMLHFRYCVIKGQSTLILLLMVV